MKKLYNITLILLLVTLQVIAQNTGKLVTLKQQKTLQKLANLYQREATANKKYAFKLAKIHKWDTLTISKDGTIKMLQGVDGFGRPKYLKTFSNVTSAGTTRTNSLYLGGSLGVNITGSSDNMTGKLAIWDGGLLLINHQELAGRIINNDGSSLLSSHATHVAGTMMARGVNANARGMAWGIKSLLAYDFDNDLPEMTTAAGSLLISNHSYGFTAGWDFNSSVSPSRWEWLGLPTQNEDYKFGFYDVDAQKWDEICYNAPYYLPVQAAGNSRDDLGPAVGESYWGYPAGAIDPIFMGNRPAEISSNNSYDIIPTAATAKNSLTVGAVRGIALGANQPSDIVMTSFSCWGPTDDGRIKPDLVGAGISVNSCNSTGISDYVSRSGTSMATPNVSASLLLLQEYFAQLNSGNFMQSATLKGLAIQTTDEAGTTSGPDYSFGWGLLNIERAANVIKSNGTNSAIFENTLLQGGQFSQSFESSGLEAVKATICWLDPPGTITPDGTLNNRTPKLVNDLDLIIEKGNISYRPWILNPNNPANAATKGNNIVDNVEQVTTEENIADVNYTFRVTHKGQLLSGEQNYSLIISGIKIVPLPLQLVNFTVQKQNNSCLLKWETLTEKNTKLFEILRSNDGQNFETIYTKPAANTSTATIYYNLTDANPQIGLNYYKIKTVDLNGSSTTSGVKMVDFSLDNKSVINVYPNPVKEELNITYNLKSNQSVRILLFDMSGKKIKSLENIKTKNSKINVNNLPNGLYLLEVQDNATSKSIGMRKFIKE